MPVSWTVLVLQTCEVPLLQERYSAQDLESFTES